MKLNSIKIKDFKGIKEMECTLSKYNYLSAGNGNGKTSFALAIAATLGKKHEDGFCHNGNPYSIEAHYECNGQQFEILREHSKTRMNGKFVSNTSIMKTLESITGTNGSAVEFITSLGKFDTMSEEQLGEFFTSLPSFNIPIAKTTMMALADRYSSSVEFHELLDNFFPDNITMDQLEQGEKEFINNRKSVKRELANIKLTYVKKPTRSIEEVENEISILLASKAAVSEAAKLMAAYNDAVAARTKAEADISKMETDTTALRSEVGTLMLNPAYEQQLEKDISDIAETRSKNASTSEYLEKNNATLKRAIACIEAESCPYCDYVKCLSAASANKDTIIEEIENLIAYNDEKLSYISSDISSANLSLMKKKAELDEYRSKVAKFNKLTELEKSVKLLKGSLPELPPKPTLGTTMTESEYTIRKTALEAEKADILAYEKSEEAQKRQDEINAKIKAYDLACLFLSKGGVKKALLKKASKLFERELNAYAKQFNPSWEVQIFCDEGFSVRVRKNASDEFISYKELSSGERLIMEMLIVNLVNGLSNTGILILDNLDKLDKNNFSVLLSIVTSAEFFDNFDTIILSFVNHADFEGEMTAFPQFNRIVLPVTAP